MLTYSNIHPKIRNLFLLFVFLKPYKGSSWSLHPASSSCCTLHTRITQGDHKILLLRHRMFKPVSRLITSVFYFETSHEQKTETWDLKWGKKYGDSKKVNIIFCKEIYLWCNSLLLISILEFFFMNNLVEKTSKLKRKENLMRRIQEPRLTWCSSNSRCLFKLFVKSNLPWITMKVELQLSDSG